MEEKDVVRSLAALAQPMRLRVFRALVMAGLPGLTPGTLTATLGVAASTLSFHLKELAHAGLVSQEREGRNLIYRARYEHMEQVLGYLTEHFCHGQPCMPSAVPAAACASGGRKPARSKPSAC